jgi:formylglycine-generating enzyme required for sulfatase activity
LLGPLEQAFRRHPLADRRLVAATLLADYARTRPAVLVRLALVADARQYAVLLPRLQDVRARAVPLLRQVLKSRLRPRWKDAPLPALSPPDPAVVRRLEGAHGLLAERFALCQDLPLGQLVAVADGLRSAGYRPLHVRPYAKGSKVQVAAVWTRDEQDWRLALGISARELFRQDAKNRQKGFVAVDVAGYGEDGNRYAALWAKGDRRKETHLMLGMPHDRHKTASEALRKSGFVALTLQAVLVKGGLPQYSSVWQKDTIEWDQGLHWDEDGYDGVFLDKLPLDVSLVRGTGRWEAVQPEVQAWLSAGPTGGLAGLPLLALFHRSQSPFIAGQDRWYAGVWHASAVKDVVRLHGLGLAEHLGRCRQLAARGYRPAALTAAVLTEGKPVVAASVWHRPVVPEGAKDALAGRQANAGVTLLHLGRPEGVWSLLRHRPDPRVRSYLIHRLAPLGVPPRLVIGRLREEKEVSARRALLLALGEYDQGRLGAAQRRSLVPELLKWYRDSPDAGLHGAVDWLLRRWGNGKALARIDRQLAGGSARGRRQWYVNGQGQTLTIIHSPGDFLMGSPGSEPDCDDDEVLHRRRIGRSFAIGTKPVTLDQFKEFRKAHPDVEHHYRVKFSWGPNVPANGVSWYLAAMYCQWLSEREKVPKDQWCYPAVAEMKAALKAGRQIHLPADYLHRTGYRLPTEAEWEFACRAGAVTSRFYGSDETLLAKYSWYLVNSPNRTRPVGLLKPNDLGLFDMNGNVWQWCQNHYFMVGSEGKICEDKEDINRVISNDPGQALRGGSFLSHPTYVRCAQRDEGVPTNNDDSYGLRVARTVR